ncbi:hypothetical protein ACP70R_016720 [Stipagrostis hirtigluma subsp. patula]
MEGNGGPSAQSSTCHRAQRRESIVARTPMASFP